MNDAETEKLCLADRDACIAKDGYVNDTHCLTKIQCERFGTYEAVSSTRTCEARNCTAHSVCADCANANQRYPYWDGAHCVSCAAGTHAQGRNRPYLDTAHMECVEECPEEAPLSNSDNVCEPCPAETPVWDNVIWYLSVCRSCTEIYGDTRPYWSPLARTCLPTCPPELVPIDGSMTCRTCAEVNPDKPHWDIYAEECVLCPREAVGDICPSCYALEESLPVWDEETQSCRSCVDVFGAEKAIWNINTRQCVSACPAATPAADSSCGRVCPACTELYDNNPLWDPEAERCVRCPPETPSWSGEYQYLRP